MLQEQAVIFEVLQEYSTSARGEKIVLGYVRLNLAEYVDVPGERAQDAEEGEKSEGNADGVVRRYLMQESKINSTLKVRDSDRLVLVCEC